MVASDTTCTNSSNTSRICTLINAATQFVNTLTGAITAGQQLYIGVVPYVTTVNVGNAFCSGPSTCSSIAATGTDFTDLRGNIMPVTPITGNTTNGSSTISSISPSTSAIQAGMLIYGQGIPSGATVNTVSSSSQITISSNATATYTGNSLAVGPSSGNPSTPFTDPTTYTATATTSTSSTTVTLATGTTTNNIVAGMAVSSSTSGVIASGTTVATVVSATQITLSAKPSKTEATAVSLTFSIAGSLTSSSTTVSSLAGPATIAGAGLNSIVVGMTVTDASSKIPANTYVTSVSTSAKTLALSASATGTVTADTLTFTNLGGATATTSATISNVSFSTVPIVGQVIVGNGIPANTTITSLNGSTAAQYAAGSGSLTISRNAAAPSNFSSATGNCCNTALAAFAPLTYASAYDTASPAGSSTTTNWGGCVIEPTSSGEDATGTGVLSVTGNPDTSEPASGTSWYPYYWVRDSTNSWASGTVSRQDTTTETQGETATDWLHEVGPNQGCPVPLLPLTDVTSSTGKTQVLNTISSMWPRDAGGTQVHIGMIWGWRVLSPNGPFTPNNGHPLGYSTAASTAWKKAVVLMTDGTEEWPATDNMTGLGQIADGKIGTTSNTTAVTNLGTRLTSLCSNMAASGNFIIYTIGLGTDGASNTALQNCATTSNGGFFEAATTSNLQKVFQDIAKSLIALRLTK